MRLRRIGSALRKAREASGMTIETACRRYGRSKGWLSTLENGLHSIEPQELTDLLDFYGVPPGPLRESLLHLAARTNGKGWERPYEGHISAAALDFMSLEQDSVLIRNYEACVVPGLMQTYDYARALFSLQLSETAKRTGALLDFRMDRQRIMTGPHPPHFISVISESVLFHEVGGPEVMLGQINRIAEMARWSHVHLRIIPQEAGIYLGIASPYVLLTLRPPGALTVSVLEQFAKSVFVDNEHQVAEHERAFEQLLEGALDEESSLALVEELAAQQPASPRNVPRNRRHWRQQRRPSGQGQSHHPR
ncbi:helix-turn-helix domain-containing protein [Actinomadura macrotermitis]|uniref:helix-turn-helix domain-containing protein n=1 Tax=Actinomadura macrotermitis TaxID=2585200 RepID=UPI0018868D7B|nr:helix-turn-helix transcriptional regulator [Actinomadura macrotermitis]